jgi:hypothetical protein
MLEQLTVESFEPHIGTSFWAEFPSGGKVELRLVRAARVMESEAARLDRQPFSLFFIGPRSYLIAQQTCHLTHPALGALDIFIVPVGQDAQTYQ